MAGLGMAGMESPVDELLKPGSRVEVRSRFDGAWTRGFEVAEQVDDGYRLRRLSDQSVLPAVFAHDDLRRERKRDNFWWH